MPYQWTHVAEPGRHQWVLKRNCALSPRQLATCFAALATASLVIAIAFATHGAWPVIPYACVEVAALAAAFVFYGRHAADFERIVLERDRLVVERAHGPQLQRTELSAAWLRVEYDGTRRDLIRLVAGREALSVGRFVPDECRARLAQELRASLRG